LLNYLRRNEILLILCIEGMLMLMGMGQVSPILALYAEHFGISMALVGLIITSFAFASVVVDIPAGRIADRLGRRPTLITGCLVLATGSVGCALAPDYWLFVACRLIQGTGFALYTTTAMIMLTDISTVNNRGNNMGLYMGSTWIGFALGPISGGFVGQYFGLPAVFFVYAFFCVLAAIWAYLRLPETHPFHSKQTTKETDEQSPTTETGLSIKELLVNPNFILICIIAFCIFFTNNGSRYEILPLLSYDRLGLSAGEIGVAVTVIGIANIIVLLFTGRLSDRFGRKPMILPGCVFMAAGLVMWVIASSYQFIILSCVVFGIGIGMAGPSPAAYVADILSGQNPSRGMSAFRAACDLGFVVGPVFQGWLADLKGYNLPLIFNATLLFTAALVFQIAAREHHSFVARNYTRH
jgi:DHA1 family multidrug resistance protein-like MFS transporter